MDWLVEMAYQRTAFLLNENGAEVESEVAMDAEGGEDLETEEEKPLPKAMIFDKPFLVFLKRNDSQYPYFAMLVANSEVLKKQVNK